MNLVLLRGSSLLNAAGTPIIKPLPFSSLASESLLPGELSMSSTSGMASPTLTFRRDAAEKARAERGMEGAKRRAANIVKKYLLYFVSIVVFLMLLI